MGDDGMEESISIRNLDPMQCTLAVNGGISNNLPEIKESNIRLKQLESDITFHIGKQEPELALKVTSAAAHNRDLYQLKGLI
ncbi:hypothetical protein MLD38_033771 [Melastoma candidum]|uniref:Uncharacterized protein n=1 Tax=Melastoma candidum TaxID=119954 RepID=A0ACB9MAG1_9MYRT|nr:hypothetical protein MLD38_033771 [Melastoma candidum]